MANNTDTHDSNNSHNYQVSSPSHSSQIHNHATAIAKSYDFAQDVLELGTIVIDGQVFSDAKVRIPLAMMNRHGLIAGATGSGKTKTLQLLAESLSDAGVPVLLADVKGDLSGLSKPGVEDEKLLQRAEETGGNWAPQGYITEFTSIGTDGVALPLRAKVSSFGPILLSKVLGLNDTQESTLSLIFHWADTRGLELYDLKDLRAVVSYLISDEGKKDLATIGGVSKQSAGVILRAITVLENDGGDTFFGEPEIETADLMRIHDGKGIITLFEISDQAARPVLFSTFLLWILADLYAHLPEVGDQAKPKLVFIFDEAHTLFNGASKAFINTIIQTVKLIRSKGVGIFFCSQLPTDIPNEILSQLGTRIQHALRAFTPEDQKALTKTVKTFPTTQVYNLGEALTSLAIGEALVTVLSDKGIPTPVAWTRLRPPQSMMGDIGRDAVTSAAKASSLWPKYATTVDNISAYEKLQDKDTDNFPDRNQANPEDSSPAGQPESSRHTSVNSPIEIFEAIGNSPLVKNFLKNTSNAIGKEITRSIFGNRKR